MPERAVAQRIDQSYDDIDALAASAVAWDQHYEQLGRGRFRGALRQFVCDGFQLGRESWSPGVLQHGSAPPGTWMFALPLHAQGSLHLRRRPVTQGEILTATSHDDMSFVAGGDSELMIVVLPTACIDRWVQERRGQSQFDTRLAARGWRTAPAATAQRALALSRLLDAAMNASDDADSRGWSHVQEQAAALVLDLIPSTEVIEPLHHRARIAREVLAVLRARTDDPPNVTELCATVGARERTLYLSCLEAYGLPPAKLLVELRLNAARRALLRAENTAGVSEVATLYGFTHFGRFATVYRHRFGELPSATLAGARLTDATARR